MLPMGPIPEDEVISYYNYRSQQNPLSFEVYSNACQIQTQGDMIYIYMQSMGGVTEQDLCKKVEGKMVTVLYGENQVLEINQEVFNDSFQVVLESEDQVINLQIFNKNISDADFIQLTRLFYEGNATFLISKIPIILALLLQFSLHFQFRSFVMALDTQPINFTGTFKQDDFLVFQLMFSKVQGKASYDTFTNIEVNLERQLLLCEFCWFYQDNTQILSPLLQLFSIDQIQQLMSGIYISFKIQEFQAICYSQSQQDAPVLTQENINYYQVIPKLIYEIIQNVCLGKQEYADDFVRKNTIILLFNEIFPEQTIPLPIFMFLRQIYPEKQVIDKFTQIIVNNEHDIAQFELENKTLVFLEKLTRWQKRRFI